MAAEPSGLPGPSGPQGQVRSIELTNACNLRCPQCFQGRTAVPTGFMDQAVFMACLEHARGYTELSWRGEPLLHPQCVNWAARAKRERPDLNLGLHTNGLLLTEALFHDFCAGGLDWLHLSLHTPQSCARYREVLEWKRTSGAGLFVYAEADNTQEELYALAEGLALEAFESYQAANWAGYLTGYRPVNPDPAAHARACPWVVDNAFPVAFDGTVNACCWDFELRHALGQVRDFPAIRHRPPYELCPSCIWIRREDGRAQHTLEENYRGHALVAFQSRVYACPLSLGPLVLREAASRERPGVFCGHSLGQVKALLDRLEAGQPC